MSLALIKDALKNTCRIYNKMELKNQTELIKNLCRENEEAEVEIYKTFPFAPFLFLSAIISVCTQSSFLPLIERFFQYLLQ